MELELVEGYDIQLDPGCEFELPGYMTRLSPEEVSKETNPEVTVIAAGADPSDGKITLITLSGKMMVFDARSYYVPDGPAYPAEGGSKIFLKNTNKRWPSDTPGFSVDCAWMLEKSTSALTGATMKITYPHENHDQ